MSDLKIWVLFCLLLSGLNSCAGNSDSSSEPAIETEVSETAQPNVNETQEQNVSTDTIKPGENPLIGSWLIVNVIGEHKDLNMGYVYTWTADGQMSIKKEIEISGTYKLHGNLLIWTTKDFEFTYDFTINGNIMTLIPRGSGHTYTLRKE